MFSIQAQGAKLCDGMPRREVLRAGGLSVCGLSLSQLLAPQLKASPTNATGGRAKSCIVLFLMGGPPQHSTWDPKPLAPENVRGEIAPISTNVPGMQFGELMPKLAQQADKLAVFFGFIAFTMFSLLITAGGLGLLFYRLNQGVASVKALPITPPSSPSEQGHRGTPLIGRMAGGMARGLKRGLPAFFGQK